LTRAGYRVAVCEQTEPPKKGDKVFQRELVRTITPGTIMDGDVIDGKENNFLAALYDGGLYGWGLAYVDITTGEFRVTWESGQDAWNAILGELSKVSPSELLVDEVSYQDDSFQKRIATELSAFLTEIPASSFCPEPLLTQGIELDLSKIKRQLPPSERNLLLAPAGAVLNYLQSTQREAIDHLATLEVYRRQAFMIIDRNTERNLELLTSASSGKRWSLLGFLDHTATAMGGRELRSWILRPLLSPESIGNRQNLVEGLVAKPALREEIRKRLRQIHDIPRLLGRATFGNANARDLLSLRTSLDEIPMIDLLLREGDLAGAAGTALLVSHDVTEDPAPHTPDESLRLLDDVMELRELLGNAIADEPPLTVREGGMIRDGYNKELDEFRQIHRSGRGTIAALQEQERNRTGIPSLKVSYNKVFGYYIEVTRTHLDKIPEDYIRKQTLTNAERFITPALKEYEAKVLNAEDRIRELEYELLKELLGIVAGYGDRLQQTAQRLARLDALASLAEAASRYSYVKPVIDTSDSVVIREGRHPVLERSPAVDLFVPNDTDMNNSSNQILVITGPNMAGKSTYIRQVALIAIMAQMGSFVPAAEARIGIVDRLFSRVGASDDIARGRSTFMVEMNEAALILKDATPRSLIILDEIGRGTSTFDGVSLAWAIVEYLHNIRQRGVKTLFATHYHELAELENHLERVLNYHVRVSEQDGKITFLYRIERGFSDHSYGIHVAELAGVPSRVTKRARQVLRDLESGGHLRDSTQAPQMQLSLFSMIEEPLRARLASMDTNEIAPSEAWQILNELIEDAKRD
ncbi:MAG: DNA mismatch repair protein MutS, partial [bacterium]